MNDIFQIDFLLLALIFAVLYGISLTGFRHSQEHGSRASRGVKTESLKIASTIAFSGILMSCSTAWVVRLYPKEYLAPVTWAALTAQAALLSLWWFYERRGSDVIDFEAVAKHIKDSQRRVVLLSAMKLGFAGKGTMSSLEEDALYNYSRESISKEWELYPDTLDRIIPSGPGKITGEALNTFSQSFLFPRDRFDDLVTELRKDQLLKELAPPSMWGPTGTPKHSREGIDSE